MNGDDEWALLDARQQLSAAQIDAVVARISGRLTASLDREHRLTIAAANAAEHVLLMRAALFAGRSSVPCSAMSTPDEIAYVLRDSRSSMLFVGPESVEAGLAAAAAAGTHTVVGWRCAPRPGLIGWQEWLAGPTVPVDADAPAMPQFHYTSGTTGRPKATPTPPTLLPAEGSIGAMRAALEARAAQMAGPAMIVGPLNHTGPLSSFRQFAGGRRLLVMDRFDPEDFLRLVGRHRIAAAVMVPTHFQRLLALPPDIRRRYDVTSLDEIVHTGSHCPVDVKRAMIDWFGPILTEGYGATEVGATNYISSEEWLRKPGSVGRTLPPFAPLILGEDDRPVAAGEEGRIFFRAITYLTNPR